MFTSFLDLEYRKLVEAKLLDSIALGRVQEYREMLIEHGADLAYTLDSKGIETSEKSIEQIIDASIKVLESEVNGIVSTIVGDSTGNKIKGFSRTKRINVTKSAQALRSRSGKFIGALKLATLLNSMVKIKAKEIMKGHKYGNTLNFRTGRLANSVNITSFNLKRSSIHFTYLYYPYQTFEPGFAQYKKGRDPRDIFSNAIADALSLLISDQDLANTKFSVYAGRSKHGNIINGDFR